MICELLRLNPSYVENTVCIYLIMPFMIWRNVPLSHKVKLNVFRYTRYVSQWVIEQLAAIVEAVGESTEGTLERLVRALAPQLNDEAIDVVTHRLVSKRMASNFLSMGIGEIIAVPLHELRTLNFLSSVGAKQFWALYTDNDVWAPEADAVLLKDTCPWCDVEVMAGLTHGFVATSSSIERVVDAVLAKGISEAKVGGGCDRSCSGEEGSRQLQLSPQHFLLKTSHVIIFMGLSLLLVC